MYDQTPLRICLIIGSIITAGYVMFRIRKAKVQIEDTIFWLAFSAMLMLLALFPRIAYWISGLLGFISPINCVYLCIIFMLLTRQFHTMLRISELDSRLRVLTEQVALNQEKQERAAQEAAAAKQEEK